MIVNDKIGLILSGGGFRGVAHLGILQYIQELGIAIDAISGASAGSLVGALIAEGYDPKEVLTFCKDEDFFNYTDLSIKNGGLFSTVILEKIVKRYIPHDSFERLKMPLYISVTDLTHARPLIFHQGSLSFAVKSSCCFPLFFQPVEFEPGVYLSDGGLLNNFPYEQIKATCNKTIGINVDPIQKYEGKFGYKETVARIIHMMTSNVAKDAGKNCDVYLQPDKLDKYGIFDTKNIDTIYNLGYTYASTFEEELKMLKENK